MVAARKSACNKTKKSSKSSVQKKSISKTRKSNTNDKQKHSSGIQTQKKLNIWDLYYDEEQRKFNGKIKFWCDIDIPQIVCSKLNSEQNELLKATAFGQFVDVEKRRMFTQVIHQGLMREIHQTQESEIWFLFGEERSRFSLAEFCLISGLKGSGNSDLAEYECVENSFLSKYFPDDKVNRAIIRKKFDDAVFDNNDEAIRLACILLVFNFLLATVDNNNVDHVLLNFLSCGDIDSFPWGKVGFDILIKSLRPAIKGNVSEVENGVFKYNFYNELDCRFYKLNGLVYVFQVFLFETLVDLKRTGFCTDDRQSNVRLFKWIEKGKLPQMKKLWNNVFGKRKIPVRKLVPTSEEMERFELDKDQFPEILNQQKSAEKGKKKKKTETSNISEIKELIDSRVNPISRKMKRLRKEVRGMKIQVSTEMDEFRMDVKKMVDDAFEKILNAFKVDGNYRNPEAQHDFANTDNAASKSGDNDVSMGQAKQFATENDHASEQGKKTAVDVDDKEEADIECKGMEVVLYTPVQLPLATYLDNSFKAPNNVDVQEVDVDVQQVDVGFDINFTTQDVIQIDEVVRSFSKGRRRPVRAVKKSRVLRSPFTPNLTSKAAQSKAPEIKKPMGWISAFPTECMHMPSSTDNTAFDLWFKIGINKRKKYEKFPGVADVITPPFKFGGVEIKSKMWFYRLLTPGQYMDNNHIDVCFYYLRKLARNSMHIPIRVTTTDCLFHAVISGLYKTYNDNDHDETMLTRDDFLVKYIRGTTAMRAGSGWADVDHIIFPIHMTRPDHWFMLAFDVSRRRLVAYNSYQSNGTQMLEKISDICEPYIYMLPILLSKCGFWGTRNDNERSSSAYMGVEECDQIDLEIAKNLPEQTDSDCGMFTIGFAEHYIHKKIPQIPKPFPVPEYRKKLCANLYQYTIQKLSADNDSGTE